MSERRRGSLLVTGWVCLGLCLVAAGCQLQIAFVDPNANAPSPGPTADVKTPAAPAGIVQVSDTLPLPQPLTNGMSLPGPGPDNHGPLPGGPGMLAVPGAPGGPPLAPPVGSLSTELAMRSLPPYVIEPPDILILDTIRMVPKPPYTVQPLDVLLIRLAEPLQNQPIEGTYTVGPDGVINLGFSYGMVRVGGLSLVEVERAIRQQLISSGLKDPQIAVGLAQFRGVQQARGQHLVRMDGTINLGSYGCVYVAGLTLPQAKVAIERHLSQYVCDPEITVDVYAYNSKFYYVVSDGAGYGQAVYRFPIVGKETVLDAINNIGGIPTVGSKKKIWVARPAPANHPCLQVLPVDWKAIVQGGATTTNYQIFPGDRVFIQSDPLIRFDNTLAKILQPIERLFGATLLGNFTIRSFRNNNGSNNSGTPGFGFVAPIR